MNNVVIIIVILLLVGAFGSVPVWSHQGFGMGWGPSGLLFTVLVVLVILAVMGKLGNGPSA